jgi:hypothetical protein
MTSVARSTEEAKWDSKNLETCDFGEPVRRL